MLGILAGLGALTSVVDAFGREGLSAPATYNPETSYGMTGDQYRQFAGTERERILGGMLGDLSASESRDRAMARRMVSEGTPGLASFRAGAAASGMSSRDSQTLAEQKRKAAMRESYDRMATMTDQLASRYSTARMGARQFGEQMGSQYQQMGFQSDRAAMDAINRAREFNANSQNQFTLARYNRPSPLAPIGQASFGILGQMAGQSMAMDSWMKMGRDSLVPNVPGGGYVIGPGGYLIPR